MGRLILSSYMGIGFKVKKKKRGGGVQVYL